MDKRFIKTVFTTPSKCFFADHVKRTVKRSLIMALLAFFLILEGCGRPAAVKGKMSGKVETEVSGPASSTSNTGKGADISKGAAGGNSQIEQLEGKDTKDMELNSLYLELLGIYLKEQLGLEDYDQEISDFGCLTVDKEDQSESQREKNMGLDYLYLRNDVHVERLTEEDQEILKAGQNAADTDARDHAMEVVVRTFPVCITPMPIEQEEDKKFPYVYDNNVSSQGGEETVTMDTLLLRIATMADYDEDGEYVDAYKEVQKEKRLYELKERMETEMEGLLGDVPIKVLVDFII